MANRLVLSIGSLLLVQAICSPSLSTSALAQSSSQPPRELEIEKLLNIQPLVNGRSLPTQPVPPSKSTSLDKTPRPVGESRAPGSTALDALLNARNVVPSGRTLPPGIQPSHLSRSTGHAGSWSNGQWQKPVPMSPGEGVTNDRTSEGANPLRSGRSFVAPASYQDLIAPGTPEESSQTSRQPRTLHQRGRSQAQALPLNSTRGRGRQMGQSLSEAVTSPNLPGTEMESGSTANSGVVISEHELQQLRTKVRTASATEANGELLLMGPATEDAISLAGPEDEDTTDGPSSSDSQQEASLVIEEFDSLLDDLKQEQIDNANPLDHSKDAASRVPTFQPYSTQDSAIAQQRLQDFSVHAVGDQWMMISAFDFQKWRDYIRRTHVEQGPSDNLQLAQAQYNLIRRKYDLAADALSTIDRQQLSVGDQWVWAWQQAQLAIATEQPRMLMVAMEDLKTFGSHSETAPFLSYCEAWLYRLKADPDYSTCVKQLETCLQEIQDVSAGRPAEGFVRSIQYLEFQAHLAMATSILVGPFVRAEETADRWWDAGRDLAQSRAGTPADTVRLFCLLERMEAKANAGNTKKLAVDWAFLNSRLNLLKPDLAGEDADWLDERIAELNYATALAHFKEQDLSTAAKYLENSQSWYATRAKQVSQPWYSYCLARCYWLSGALEDWQGRHLAALKRYDQFVNSLPNDVTTRISADQANQGERLGTVAVAQWRKGNRQRAIQLAEASVSEILMASETGATARNRIERLEQNLATMKFQLANPQLPTGAQAQSRQGSMQTGNQNSASATGRNGVPAQPASTTRPVTVPKQDRQQSQPMSAPPSSGSSTPIKTFWKNLFSGTPAAHQNAASSTVGSRGFSVRGTGQTPASSAPASK